MLIDHLLQLPAAAIPYVFGRSLAERYPGRAVLEASYGRQDFDEHAAATGGEIFPHAAVYQQWLSYYWSEGIGRSPQIVSATVHWRGQLLDLHVLTYDKQSAPRVWIVADSQASAEAYFGEVSTWSAELRSQILVFEGGCWTKSDELYRDITAATFDNLILQGSLKNEIRADIEGFFASRDLYAQYRIPWKRGILFIGPPGNGKTHALKALLNTAHRNCLYVKSFDLPGSQFPQGGIASVFERARRSTPCVVVLEDLDALVGDHNRSFFLNELDGFAANEGIVVLATTNHPERLDAAILDRPSRFDRKYYFALPERAERKAYLRLWNATLDDAMVLDAAAIDTIADASNGYSFAYLRELFLSSMMRWISDGRRLPFAHVMTAQVATLRDQMATPLEPAAGVSSGPGSIPPGISPAILAQIMAEQVVADSTFFERSF